MSRNLPQIYIDNPSTTVDDHGLFYLVSGGLDSAISGFEFKYIV